MSKIKTTPVARSVPFDPDNTSFDSDNTQDAIVEAKNIAVGLPRYTIVTVFNGTVSNDQWLGYSNLIPGDGTPLIIPSKASLKEVTFSNSRSGVDGNINLYKNGMAGGNIFNTLNVDNEKEVTFAVDELFQAGDTLRGRWDDQGQNPSDAAIVYFFQVEE